MPGGGGVLPYIRVFAPFRSENGYTLCLFCSGIGFGFRRNYGSVRTYLSFQFQMSKKEREICEFEIDLKYFFSLRSNLSNDNMMSV